MALSSRVVACYLNANKGVSESKIRQKLKGCNGSIAAVNSLLNQASAIERIREFRSTSISRESCSLLGKENSPYIPDWYYQQDVCDGD